MSNRYNLESIVCVLQQTIEQMELEKEARKYCLKCIKGKDCDLPKSWVNNIEIKYHSHKLCFKNSMLDYPFIETRLIMTYKNEEVGHYRLISLLNGEPDDDYFVIYDEYRTR